MKQQSLYKQFKSWLGGIGFRLFLWGNEMTAEEYWEQVYQQEVAHKAYKDLPSDF